MAQLVSAPPCHGGGRGFESRQGRQRGEIFAAFRPGSSVGTSVRLKSGRSAVRSRPWPPCSVRPLLPAGTGYDGRFVAGGAVSGPSEKTGSCTASELRPASEAISGWWRCENNSAESMYAWSFVVVLGRSGENPSGRERSGCDLASGARRPRRHEGKRANDSPANLHARSEGGPSALGGPAGPADRAACARVGATARCWRRPAAVVAPDWTRMEPRKALWAGGKPHQPTRTKRSVRVQSHRLPAGPCSPARC